MLVPITSVSMIPTATPTINLNSRKGSLNTPSPQGTIPPNLSKVMRVKTLSSGTIQLATRPTTRMISSRKASIDPNPSIRKSLILTSEAILSLTSLLPIIKCTTKRISIGTSPSTHRWFGNPTWCWEMTDPTSWPRIMQLTLKSPSTLITPTKHQIYLTSAWELIQRTTSQKIKQISFTRRQSPNQ